MFELKQAEQEARGLHPLSLLLIAHSKKTKSPTENKARPEHGPRKLFRRAEGRSHGHSGSSRLQTVLRRAERAAPMRVGEVKEAVGVKVFQISLPLHTHPLSPKITYPRPYNQSFAFTHTTLSPRAPFQKPENATRRRKGKITDWRLNCVPRHTYNKKT